MNIGILSDTHGNMQAMEAAIHVFDKFDVKKVIHCGDIGTGEIVDSLAEYETHFVLGNCDRPAMQQVIELSGNVCHGRFGEVDWDDVLIAFLHGDNEPQLRKVFASGEYNLICCGHTHIHDLEKSNGTLKLNPGALSRTHQPSVAIVKLPELEIIRVAL